MPDDKRVKDGDPARVRRTRLSLHRSGYMLVDIFDNRILLGEDFEASFGDIADYLVETEPRRRETPSR
jgi:hypothetical protein